MSHEKTKANLNNTNMKLESLQINCINKATTTKKTSRETDRTNLKSTKYL